MPAVQIFGHRGSVATHPENSVAGFRHAMACGADGVELDVMATRDDVLVVTHDFLWKDGRRVGEHLGADLPLPTLHGVLALDAPEAFVFDVEAKIETGLGPNARRYAQLLHLAIRGAQVGRRVIVRSFDHDVLLAFHEIEPEVPLAALIESASDRWVEVAHAACASIISPKHSTVTAERVDRAHEAGIRVSVWTVNEVKDWERFAAMEVDVLITDDPEAALRYFGR